MAPELFTPDLPVTFAADVYSLGVLAYQLLVGTLPFEDDDPLGLVTAHLESPPPDPRRKLPHLPSRAARLVRRMLAKEPLRRPSMEELIDLLTALEIETFAQRMAG
jgi:serine/threonine-protein kinase